MTIARRLIILLAVLEIASFREFAAQEKALLEEVLPLVALSLEILMRNLHTQELLKKSQEQAHRLELQTEELTTQQEELLAQQQELHEAREKADEATQMKSMFLANMSHEIRLRVEVLQLCGGRCELRFSVRDTGLGMSREQSARLFQPFTQADMSTTRKHGGTGLGLTICRRLAELMRGKIWLESEAGGGSTFAFTVWLGIGEDRRAARILPGRLAALRVLVVDDNHAACEIIQESLRDVAHQADAVHSGADAVAAVRSRDGDEPYDVVFMDWRMPGMDGRQAARLIKSDETLRHQPAIVLVTAFGREEVRKEAECLRLEGFLVKPVTSSMLVDALVNVFAETALETAAVGAESASESVRLVGMRILLAEDNEINQQIAVELLEGVGARVDIANHGREAVDMLLTAPHPTPYHVVLMDLQMPEMDGYQATARIRSEARFADLPLAERLAHSLKGVAGNIGARAVLAGAAELESALAQRLPRESLAPLVDVVARALEDLVGSLRLALGLASPALSPGVALPVVDAAATRKAIDEITRLLAEFDSGAVEALEGNEAALRTLFSPADWGIFSQRVVGYAFAEAGEQLRQATRTAVA